MRKILISGAGIAGTALAYWLGRYGHEVTVVERAPRPRPGGQAVDLRGAGRTVVERMGLMPEARRVGLDQKGMAWLDARGRVAARMPAEAFGGEGLISEIEILRGDLNDLFYAATQPGTEYLFDDTITGLTQDDDGVDVTFERGAPRRFDLVVGADGLHSVTRRLAFGPEAECVRPLGLHMSWFTAPAAPDLDGWYAMYNLPGGRVASLRPGRLPGQSKASLSFRSAGVDDDRRDVAAQKRRLAEKFAGGGWKVPWMVEAMLAADDFTLASLGQVHLDSWSRGRVTLVGDAGYCPTPLTGLGTSLALVGAYVLGCELASGSVADALRRYEAATRPYVTQAQELPPGGARGYAPMGALGIRATRLSMRSMTRWPMKGVLEKQFAKAGNVVLPDYPPP